LQYGYRILPALMNGCTYALSRLTSHDRGRSTAAVASGHNHVSNKLSQLNGALDRTEDNTPKPATIADTNWHYIGVTDRRSVSAQTWGGAIYSDSESVSFTRLRRCKVEIRIMYVGAASNLATCTHCDADGFLATRWRHCGGTVAE